MTLPLVSILIPVYNRVDLIEEAIASAQAQDYSNIEIVVGDNQSTDGTWGVVQRMAAKDARIRAIRNSENLGPVRNWLACLEAATGAYVKMLFSDDLLFPHCITRMMAEMEKGAGLVLCQALIGPTPDSARRYYFSNKGSWIGTKRLATMMMAQTAPVSPGAALFSSEDLRRNLHGEFPGAPAYDFWATGAGPDAMSILLTASDHGGAVAIQEPLTFFRAHAGSLSIGNHRPLVLLGYTAAFSWYLQTQVGAWARISFVAQRWLQESIDRRGWAPVRPFLSANMGGGSNTEAAMMIAVALTMIPKVIAAAILRRLTRRFSNRG